MYWPDLKLPPINLWSLPWWIDKGGTVKVDSDRLLRSETVKKQIEFVKENYDIIKERR